MFESLPHTGEPNHFNLLRLVAAATVIVSHAYSLTLGGMAPDPLQRLIGVDAGATAVLAFFAISGYFISWSFDRRSSNLAFIFARVTRIMPGLLVVALFAAFIVGPSLTILPLPVYFAQSSVWLYPLRILTLYGAVSNPTLPGLFVQNPDPTVNGSLWTLFFEASCYVALFAVGLLGFLRRDRFAWVLLAWFPAYLFARYGPWSPYLKYFAIFSLPFVIGMVAYQFRSERMLKGWVALPLFLAAAGAGLAGHLVEELWSAAIAYSVLWVGFAPAPVLLEYNRVGDFSYGTYIYGFLIGQIIVALVPGIHPLELIALSLPLGIFCGVLSWGLVERPALKLRTVPFPRRSHGAELRT